MTPATDTPTLTLTDRELLEAIHIELVAARKLETEWREPGASVAREAMLPGVFRLRVVGWLRVIGVVVLVWAVASVVVGVWVGVQVAREDAAVAAVSDSGFGSWLDCMDAPDTTSGECRAAFPDEAPSEG